MNQPKHIEGYEYFLKHYSMLIKRKEAGEILGIGPNTFDRVVKMGAVTPVYIDGIKFPYYGLIDVLEAPKKLTELHINKSEKLQ